MTELGYAAFEIEAPVASDGSLKTGRFEVVGAAEGRYSLTESIRTGYLIDSGFDNVVSIYNQLTENDAPLRQGVHLDLGGGEHAVELEFENPGESTTPDGTVAQWGSSVDTADGPNPHTATGAAKEQQMAVLMNYLRKGRTDSFTPATLQFGEIHPGGFLEDSLDVAIEQPNTTLTNDSPSRFDVAITFVATSDIKQTLAGKQRPG